MKAVMIKKMIFSLIIISMLIIPVSAFDEIINLDYEVNSYIQTITGTGANNYADDMDLNYFRISDITQATEIYSIIIGYDLGYGVNNNYPNNSHMESACDVYIGTDCIGSGNYEWSKQFNAEGEFIHIIAIVTFDELDITGYTGYQIIGLELDDVDVMVQGRHVGASVFNHSSEELYLYNGMFDTCKATQYTTTYTNLKSELKQWLGYSIKDNCITGEFSKTGIDNHLKIVDNRNMIVYDASSPTDLIFNYTYVDSLTFLVWNPIVGGDDPYWNLTIPEPIIEPTPEPTAHIPVDFSFFKAYIYDAQTGNLIGGSVLNVRENLTADDPYLLNVTNKDGVSEYTFEWADDVDWLNFTASAIGYNPSTEYFNHSVTTAPPGSTVDMTFHLVSDGSLGTGAYALSFLVYQSVSSSSALVVKSSDATVICDGVQHMTSSSGTTWFNVTAGDHAYTISKNGFETLQGTVTIDSNYLKTVTLDLGPDTPTVDDPAGNETGEVGDEAMHTAVAESYAQFGAFIPEAVMIACVLFLLSMFKKF